MAGAAGEGGGSAGGSRIPNNWQGLFRFCQEATAEEDPTVESSFVEMDPENLKDQAQPSFMWIDTGASVTDQYGNVLEAQGSNVAVAAASVGPKDEATKDPKRAGATSSGYAPKGNPKVHPKGQGQDSDLDPEVARINQDKALEALGLYRYRIPGDGNCLYRAVAWQLKFDQEKYHPLLRRVSVKWMREYAQELMASGLLDTVEEIEETDTLGTWPGQAAIVSLANIFGINIAIVQGGDKGDIDIQHIAPFEQETTSDQGSVILAYLYNGHYDAVVDGPNMENPDFEKWMFNVQKAHSEGKLSAQSPVAQDPYYSYVLHNGYDTLKLRQQEGETLPAYVATSAPASSAAPPHLNHAAPVHDTHSLEQEPLRFETDHSLETIRSKVDRPTVQLQEVFTPDEEFNEEFDTLNGAPKQGLSLQDTIHNLDNERESGITNKLAYHEGDVLIEEGSTVPVPMTTDDVMTDIEIRERLPSDMFASSSASSLATESEMSIHLDDDMETASQNSHFDSDCESRFAQPQESSVLFDDVFDHGIDQSEQQEEPITTKQRYTKSLDRRWLRNRNKEGLVSPPGSAAAGELEELKPARPAFQPRQKIQRTTAKEASPYQRPQAPEKKSDGWGIKTSELLQAAGVTHVKPGETLAQVSQKYGPVPLEEQPGVMSPENTMNKDSGSNTGTLRSERFLAKRKKEGRKFPLLKTDGDTGQDNAIQSVLSPPADIPSSANVLSNLEALQEWRQKYGPQANNTSVHDGESGESIREGSYDSPDILMRRSESREESVESVIHVPSQQQKDTSRENSSVNSLQNDSTMRPSMQDMAHTEEMTVAGGYANNTQPLSSSNAKHGDYIKHNTRSVSSPSRTFMSDTGDSNTMTKSLPYKSSVVNSETDRTQSNTSSPISADGDDGPRGFSRRKAGYQHPRLARSRSNDAILDSPDRDGFDPSDSVRGSGANATETTDSGYDTLKGSSRAQALLKSRMRPGRSPGRSLGKDPVDGSSYPDSVHTTQSGRSNYSSLPYDATKDKRYEQDRTETKTESVHTKQDLSSLPSQPFFNPDPPGPSVPSESQPSQSHPGFSSSRPSMSSSYMSSSSHTSEGPGLTNEELVNARRFSLESSQRVEDVLVRDPSHVLPPELAKNLTRPQGTGTNDKSSFEASRRFRQAEQEYRQTNSSAENETKSESESRYVGGGSKLAGNSNFARASNASQQIGQSSSMHEKHVGYNQHDGMSQVDSSFNRELTAQEKSIAAAYSIQSASADVMSGMSALSGISLSKSDEPTPKAPPRFVRQLSSPSLGRKVIHEMQQDSPTQAQSFTQPKAEQPKPFVQQEQTVQHETIEQPKPFMQQEPIIQPKPNAREEPIVQPKPVVNEQPFYVQPKPVEINEPTVQSKPIVNQVTQPKPFMLQEQPVQSNAFVQEETFIEKEPIVQPKTLVEPVVPPKPMVQNKAQQETIVQPGPVLQKPSVQPKPTVQNKPFQPFRIADIPKKVVQNREVVQQQHIAYDQQESVNELTNNEEDQLDQPQRIVEKEIVSPPVLHAEDSRYGFPVKQTAQEQHSNELMKSKLWQQQQQKMHEMQQEVEVVNDAAAVESASVRRQEITSQVSTSDDVKGSVPRMRVLPLHFVGGKGQTFSRQLSQEEEQSLLARRAKREEYERQSSKESSRDQTPQRGRSSTRESSQESYKSVPEEAASRSPKRYRSVERILVGDANVAVNGPDVAASAATPLSPGASAPNQPGIQIRVANEQGVLTQNEVGAQQDVRRTTENVVHEIGSENMFEKVRSGASHSEIENAMRQQGAQGSFSGQSTPISTPQEELTSPRIIQTDPYRYPSLPDPPSYASSVCSSTGLREVEEIHCQHPGHHHGRNVKARSQIPASLLFPGKVTSSRTSPAGSTTSSPYVTPPTSGRTSPSMSMHSQGDPYRRTIPVQVTNETRKGNFMRSHSHWDDRKNDFEKRVDNMFNQHVERERRGSVPVRVSRQPADGASLPNHNQGQEKAAAAGPPAAVRSNSVPNAAQPTEGEQGQDDRPPPGIVKDRLREWVEGQRAHQGNWDSYSQQSDAPSKNSQSQQSETDSQYTQSCDESGSMHSEDSRAESATPTPGQSEQSSFASGARRFNSHPEPQMPFQHGPQHGSQHGSQYGPQHGSQHGSQHGPQHGSQHGPQHGSQHGPQHRLHREFVEERATTDPMTGGTQWHRSFATESSGFTDGGRQDNWSAGSRPDTWSAGSRPDTWSARVELPNRPDWPRTGRRERFLRLRDRPFFVDAEREFEFPSMLRPMRHRLRDDIKSAFDDDWFFRH